MLLFILIEIDIYKVNVCTRVANYIQPAQLLPIPNELIEKIVKDLPVADLRVLAQLNRHGRTHAAAAMIERAKKLGYKGENHTEAVKYINDLFQEVIDLARQEVIPTKHLSYKENRKTLDSERILQTLQNLSTEDLFAILSNEKLYSPNFQKIRKIFHLKGNWKVTKIDRDAIKQKGSAALILSAKNGDKGIAELLLQHKADPTTPDGNGSFPLHHAAQAGNEEIVELLLNHGAKVNKKVAEHNTPLLFACGYGNRAYHRPNARVVELLLKHNADPNIPDRHGTCPLHYAAHAGYEDIVELLLTHGARVNERFTEHGTALVFACGYGDRTYHKANAKVVELLLKHNANPNIPDPNGNTPLRNAYKYNFSEAVALLSDSRA